MGTPPESCLSEEPWVSLSPPLCPYHARSLAGNWALCRRAGKGLIALLLLPSAICSMSWSYSRELSFHGLHRFFLWKVILAWAVCLEGNDPVTLPWLTVTDGVPEPKAVSMGRVYGKPCLIWVFLVGWGPPGSARISVGLEEGEMGTERWIPPEKGQNLLPEFFPFVETLGTHHNWPQRGFRCLLTPECPRKLAPARAMLNYREKHLLRACYVSTTLFFFKKFFSFFVFDCAGSSLLHRLFCSWGVWASHSGGFSCCGAQALGHAGVSSCSSQALEHRLSSHGARAWLLCGIWDCPRSGI